MRGRYPGSEDREVVSQNDMLKKGMRATNGYGSGRGRQGGFRVSRTESGPDEMTRRKGSSRGQCLVAGAEESIIWMRQRSIV